MTRAGRAVETSRADLPTSTSASGRFDAATNNGGDQSRLFNTSSLFSFVRPSIYGRFQSICKPHNLLSLRPAIFTSTFLVSPGFVPHNDPKILCGRSEPTEPLLTRPGLCLHCEAEHCLHIWQGVIHEITDGVFLFPFYEKGYDDYDGNFMTKSCKEIDEHEYLIPFYSSRSYLSLFPSSSLSFVTSFALCILWLRLFCFPVRLEYQLSVKGAEEAASLCRVCLATVREVSFIWMDVSLAGTAYECMIYKYMIRSGASIPWRMSFAGLN